MWILQTVKLIYVTAARATFFKIIHVCIQVAGTLNCKISKFPSIHIIRSQATVSGRLSITMVTERILSGYYTMSVCKKKSSQCHGKFLPLLQYKNH